MQFVNEFRDAELVHGVIEEIRRTVTRPWVIDGNLRRADPRDHALRAGPAAAAGNRAGARPGLPGVRHPAGADRPGPGDRRPART